MLGQSLMAVSRDGSDVKELVRGDPGGVTIFDWSPDGGAILAGLGFGSPPTDMHVVKSDGSGFRTLDFGPTFIAYDAAWRPDGRHIAFLGEEEDLGRVAFIADADGTNVRHLPIGPVDVIRALAWSPDGRHLSLYTATTGSPGRISIADVDEDGAVTRLRKLTIDPESSFESRAKWSPDGSQLAVLLDKDSRRSLGITDATGSSFRLVVPNMSWTDYTWSPDGRSLVMFDAPGLDEQERPRPWEKVWSVDVSTGERTEVQTPVESWQRLAP